MRKPKETSKMDMVVEILRHAQGSEHFNRNDPETVRAIYRELHRNTGSIRRKYREVKMEQERARREKWLEGLIHDPVDNDI